MIERLVGGDRLRWVLPWAVDRVRRKLSRERPGRHLLVAICDHFEPLHGGASPSKGQARVEAWRSRYPEVAADYVDDDGRAPRHTFFFPAEEYDPALVEPLGELCEQGLGEVEVHLHHDGDGRESVRATLARAIDDLSSHGLVTRVRGRPRWAFIHGNWSLANGRRDRRWCGVDDELQILFEEGCYADFTFPSAPDQCQPPIANAIYYPGGDVRRRRSYDRRAAARGSSPASPRVLLVTGPLALARRPGRRGLRIEASALTASDPPTRERLASWVDCHVHVPGRPDWVFIKLHTHGAPEREADALLGSGLRALFDELARLRQVGWFVHYVTAREMYNLARAAMVGRAEQPGALRGFEIPEPPRARSRARPEQAVRFPEAFR